MRKPVGGRKCLFAPARAEGSTQPAPGPARESASCVGRRGRAQSRRRGGAPSGLPSATISAQHTLACTSPAAAAAAADAPPSPSSRRVELALMAVMTQPYSPADARALWSGRVGGPAGSGARVGGVSALVGFLLLFNTRTKAHIHNHTRKPAACTSNAHRDRAARLAASASSPAGRPSSSSRHPPPPPAPLPPAERRSAATRVPSTASSRGPAAAASARPAALIVGVPTYIAFEAGS
jgi:hypothetical protein